jgi:hypothetical protein
LVANDLGIQYDEALDILRDDVAWEYGGMIDNTPVYKGEPIHAAVRWLK